VVTKKQLARLKSKLPFKPGGVFIFDEEGGQLMDQKGREVTQERLKQLEQQGAIIIVDDI